MIVSEVKKNYLEFKKNNKSKCLIRGLKNHVCCFAFGFLYSFAGFGKGFSPFGVAFGCSVGTRYMLSAVCGAVTGYFIALDSVSALRYTASILAMTVIMGALKPFADVRHHIITPVIVVGTCLFVTGLAVVAVDGLSAAGLLLCFSESVVGGASAYVFGRAKSALKTKGGISCLTSKDAVSLVVCITLFLLAIDELSVAGIYPAHIIASVLILICSYYGREAGGAIVGICTGITIALGGGNIYIPCFYSLGGLLGGAFSRFGKIACFAAFFFSGFVITVISYETADISTLLVETLVSGFLYFVISYRYGVTLESILSPSVTSPVIESVKSDVVSRLKRASELSTEICNSVTAVNEALEKADKVDTDDILQKTKDGVCGSCGLYDVCWVESAEATKRTFETLLNLKKQGVYLEYKTTPQRFASSCIRTENICSNFNKLYSEYRVKRKMECRVREIHNLAAEQFLNVSSLLDSLSRGIDRTVKFDMDTASGIKATAINCGFNVSDCCCSINDIEKMTVEVRIQKPYTAEFLSSLHTQIELMTGRRFDLPVTEDNEDFVRLIYREKSVLRVVSSVVRFNSNGEKYSGDNYSTFTDSNGYFYALLCDGMGTGARAAVSSSLAVNLLEKLIKAGFGITPSIRTVNSSLISKTGDECSVTLDLFVVDTYTGYAEFYKCGAATTLVKRKGRVVDISFESMPLGILNNPEIFTGNGNLGNGDLVLMCSDGVREEDYYDLRRGLKTFTHGNVRNFTTEISESIRRKQPEKNDDMTVIALAITND